MRLIARALTLNEGNPYVFLACYDDCDKLVDSIFETLIQFVEMAALGDKIELELRDLVTKAERGLYVSPNRELPDFGINDVNLWLDQPLAPRGFVTITNENTTFDSASAELQHFTYQQFWTALDFAAEVRQFVKLHGAAALLDYSLERILPSA